MIRFAAATPSKHATRRKWLGYWLPGVLFLLGVGGLGMASYLYSTQRSAPPAAEPGLTVEQPDRVFEGAVVGQRYDVEFRIINDADEPRRVVGLGMDFT